MSDEIRTRPATQEYRDGWERTFGKMPGMEVCGVEGCGKSPRLSGLCTAHENEALAAWLPVGEVKAP